MTAGLLAFATALITSLVITVPVRQFALRIGMVDRPGPRKIHLEPIPLLGGVAIYVAVILALLVSYRRDTRSEIIALVAGATFLLLVGTLDDRGLLHHQVKLFLAMPLAGLIVFASGIRVQAVSTAAFPFSGRLNSLADAALTVFWITGITASFSILDYMDGVCAGTAAVASLFLAILAISSGPVLVSILAAAVLGAALGYLKWNYTPAKIFMGDGGAMLLGFLLATLALKLRVSAVSPGASWIAPLLVLAVPIFDTTLVSVSRLRRGLIPFTSPGKDHLGHRLANSGFSTAGSVLVMYAMGVCCGLLAILSTHLASVELRILAAMILLGAVGAIVLLECLPYERQSPESKRLA